MRKVIWEEYPEKKGERSPRQSLGLSSVDRAGRKGGADKNGRRKAAALAPGHQMLGVASRQQRKSF